MMSHPKTTQQGPKKDPDRTLIANKGKQSVKIQKTETAGCCAARIATCVAGVRVASCKPRLLLP